MLTIEDIILGNDQRGVAALRPYLPTDFCRRAAHCVISNPGTILIATGFYISMVEAPETDGPPGALALGRALESLGHRVVYVSDRYTVPILRPFVTADDQLVDFPIADDDTSRNFSLELLSSLEPAVLISVERCGLTEDGRYLNMRGVDISSNTARADHLFLQHPHTVGIGDGGNEIGMGNLAGFIPGVGSLPTNPATTVVTHLIIASISNWGAYGLVAGLSRIVGRDLLPDQEDEAKLIRRLVDLGAVDGVTGAREYTVDAMNIEEHGQVLSRLHYVLAEEGITA